MSLGKTVADLVRELCEQYPDVSERGMRAMVDDMIYDRDYYPRYAMVLNTKYNLGFARPSHKQSARQILRAA